MPWPFDSQVAPGRGGLINEQPSMAAEQFGRSIDQLPEAQPGTGGGGTGTQPLNLTKVDSTHIKVLLGTISGFVPTDVDTDIDVSGTDGEWWFYLHATISGTSVTAVELLSNIGGPVPTDDGTNSYRLVGKVVVASGIITSVTNSFAWSQAVVTCTADTAPHVWMTGA